MFAVLPFIPRAAPAVPLPFTVTLTGLSVDSIGQYGRIGNHASIGYTASETPDAVIWSDQNPAGADKSGAPATYGTGANPTDIAGAMTVHLHVRVDTAWETRSFPVRLPPVTHASSTLGFAWVVGEAITPYAISTEFILNGNTGSYAVEGLPEWVTNTSGTLTGTPPAFEIGTITITFTDSYGRTYPSVNPYVAAQFSAAVTATNSLDVDGNFQRLVTSPAHLAAYDAGQGALGLYEFVPSLAAAAPVILYLGAVAISQPDPGGSITLTQAPWAAGAGAITLGYRVMLGTTTLATSLPYSTSGRTPGEILEVFGDATAGGITTPVKIGEFTLAENPLGPVLSGFGVDYDAPSIAATSDIAATLTWRRYPPGYAFNNQAAEVHAGTGAIDGGSYAIESGANSDPITFTGGITGEQDLWLVARVGSGPLSNVIGGRVHITPSAGGPLTSPNFRGSSIGGDGTGTGVASALIPAPVYSSGDVVILPIGIDCAANLIAGLTITAPNGETVVQKLALTDNEVVGDDGQSIGLWYYRATAANTSGNITIAIAAGGTKTVEQIICTPIARFNVKASGDPFAQVVKTFSSTAVTEVTTAALTAVSAASRIEAALISEFDLPAGTAPADWFLREVGRFGPQSIQTVSRNAAVETAGQNIAAISLPLPVARRYVGVTYELLPLGT